MESFANYLVENPVITVLIAAIIFVVSLIFVVKRIFNFVLTLIFLIICLVAGYIVIYPDSANEYFKELVDHDGPEDPNKQTVKEQLQDTYESAKEKTKEYLDKLKQSTDSE